MSVESDLEFIRTSSAPTGPAQLVSLDGLSWEFPSTTQTFSARPSRR